MIQIAYVDIRDLSAHYDALYHAAAPSRRHRADSCRREEGLLCLASDALLRYAARQGGITEYTLLENQWGKPSVKDHPDFHFNLTHSGNFAAIAWGESPVGIDVECLREKESLARLAQRYFTVPEQKFLLAGNAVSRFFEVWTAKESYLKYLGTGINRPLTGFCTQSPELQVLLHTFLPEAAFVLTVCTEDTCSEPLRLCAEALL